jgi:uncharacterized RDD family membrane protein YckC
MRNFSARETEWLQELDGIELASFKQRAMALVIDSCILAVFFIIVWIIVTLAILVIQLGVGAVQGHPLPSLQQIITSFPFNLKTSDPEFVEFSHGEIAQAFFDIVVPILYFGIFLWKGKGRTPGKRIMRIRVVSLVHRHLSFWHCVERALGYGAAALEGGFGFAQFFIHPYRRCAQDRLAETIVVTERGYQAMQHKFEHPLIPDTNAKLNATE